MKTDFRQRMHYLWLLPAADSGTRCRTVIEDLAQQAGTWPFDPHLTLLGSVTGQTSTLTETARNLAQALAPLRINFELTGHGPQHFRCVYWAAALDAGLASTRAAAEQTFGVTGKASPFFPHLSLVYGALPPAARERLAHQAEPLRPAGLVVDHLQLIAGAPDHRDWQVVGHFALNGPEP